MEKNNKKRKGYSYPKGNTPWNKGIPHTEETKAKIKEKRKKQIFTKETREKLSKARKGKKPWNTGKKLPIWIRIKMGLSHRGKTYNVEHKQPINRRIRTSIEYKEWRMRVFIRDNFVCQCCGKVGGKLNAHHIKSFSDYPELRFIDDNGITLCEECHKKTDDYLKKRFHLL